MQEFEYKGYYTKIRYNEEEKWYSGKLEGIRDLVNFGSEKLSEMEQEFHSAVDDYLEFCAEVGKQAERPPVKTKIYVREPQGIFSNFGVALT